jgi:murein L,D-transpeptidase YafK
MMHERVYTAFSEKGEDLKTALSDSGFDWPPSHMFIRAFKWEKELEVWLGDEKGFRKFRTYPVCAASGKPGPKRKEGDLQVPEGFYHIDRFNPKSRFHLSLGVNYPNASDRILGDPDRPGADIFIHGNCVSEGCLAMTDDQIKDIYCLALLAKDAGQGQIPVWILPFRLENAATQKAFVEMSEYEACWPFWRSLMPAYRYFEAEKRIPEIRIGEDGGYLVEGM